jgi:hypothetical protein
MTQNADYVGRYLVTPDLNRFHRHSVTTCRHDSEGPTIMWLCGREEPEQRCHSCGSADIWWDSADGWCCGGCKRTDADE